MLKRTAPMSVMVCALGMLSGTKISAQSSATTPGAPAQFLPTNGAVGVTLSTSTGYYLRWYAASRATSYDVYFGTSSAPGKWTTVTPPVGVSKKYPGTLYASVSWNNGQRYYWRVVAKNASGSTSSPTWWFATAGATLTEVKVAPSSATIAVGATRSFTASGVWSDGTTGPVTVTWSATGGTITSAGLYTAGQTAGTYQAVATHSSGKKGSAVVTVTAAATTPTGTLIQPGQSIQAAVNANPDGTAFVLGAGIHRMQTVTPKNGNTFTGQTGAIMSGARLLTGFVQSGNTWVIGGQTQEGRINGECQAAYPRCSRPEELFIDDVRKKHVASLSMVGPGTWFFDYAGDRIYIGDNPAGRKIETSVTRAAFTGSANGVTIRNLTIEKYASPAQEAAITQRYGTTGANWLVDNCTVRWNHGSGIALGPSMHVTNNHVIANGQEGVNGGDNQSGIVVEGNEIAYNNGAGFLQEWEAGGTKFWATTNLIVRNNHVHHNFGPGLWADNDNVGTLYEGNTVEDNDWVGIVHEISYAAVIRNNIVRRNGLRDPRGWYWRAGIMVLNSPDVEVYGNTVEDNPNAIVAINQNRGTGALGPYIVMNLWVHDNRVRMQVGQTGVVQDIGDNAVFTSRNNHFDRNTYTLGPNARYFVWMNGTRTEGEWRTYGLDVTGTFIR